jgi:release factor glutamine methyltransferase
MVRRNVFSPDPELTNSTSLLLKHRPDVRGKSVLDIGTGTGILAIYAAQHGAARVTAVDIDQDALANAAENVKSHGFDSQISVLESDLFSNVPDKFDVILALLPIAQSVWRHLEHPVFNLYERFLKELDAHLLPKGKAVTSSASFGDVSAVATLLKQSRLEFETFTESKFGVEWFLFVLNSSK